MDSTQNTPLTHFQNAGFVIILYLLTFGLVVHVGNAIEKSFNDYVIYASLLFFPHGVRVLTTLIFGARLAFVYLIVAGISGSVMFGWPTDLTSPKGIGHLIVGACCAPLAFTMLKFAFGGDIIYLQKVNYRSWRIILVAIILSALINAIGHSLVVSLSGEVPANIMLTLTFILGDVLGAIAVLIATHILLNRLNLYE